MVDSGKDKRRKAEALVRKASTCTFTGKYREGLELFDEALELDPEIPRGHSGRAVALAQLGRPADALKSAQEAIRLAPAHAPAYTTLALCLDRMGRYDEAKSTYEFALTIRPENPQVLYNYACFWAAHGQEEKCRFFLTRAFQYLESGVVTHSKKDADLGPFVDADWFEELHAAAKLLEEGVSSFYAGRFDEALIAFEETLRGNKHHVRAHVGRSLALAQTGRAEEGLQSAERAIKLNADYAKGYAARAFCLHRLKRHDEAKATYEYAVNLAPERSKTTTAPPRITPPKIPTWRATATPNGFVIWSRGRSEAERPNRSISFNNRKARRKTVPLSVAKIKSPAARGAFLSLEAERRYRNQ
jgi:tetratricopeptide (TPR) repeat protein